MAAPEQAQPPLKADPYELIAEQRLHERITYPAGGEIKARGAGSGGLSFSEFVHNKRAMTGVGLVVVLGLFCFIGPLLYHANLLTVNPALLNDPPGAGHPLGTDEFGTDVLARLMVGGQSSLELGLAVGLASTLIGSLYGAVSGMIGGFGDAVMMRIVDTFLAVPTFILLIIVSSMYSLTLTVIILILIALSWADTSRLVRAQVLQLRQREFAQAATAMGATRWRILAHHMAPNTLGICIVNATFGVADSIYALSALSFLGLGPPPPFADWGTMLTDGVDNLFNGYWWQVYPPLIMLVLVVLGFRQIGDALNDIVSGQQTDASLRRRRRRFSWVPMASRTEL
jgi:peptide/nickel transport system permease protein